MHSISTDHVSGLENSAVGQATDLAKACDSPELTAAPTRRQKLIAACAAFSTCCVFYVLSAGPMAAMHKAIQFEPIQRAIEVAYAPVVFTVKHKVEPLSSIMKAYIGLFR